MVNKCLIPIISVLLVLTGLQAAYAREPYSIGWEAEGIVNAGSGDFAPYFIASNDGGKISQSAGAYIRGKIFRNMTDSTRFSYGFGAEFLAGITEPTDYLRYDAITASFAEIGRRPAAFNIQQIYGEVRYRSLFMTAGMKEYSRSIFNKELGSGDLVLSNNARPIPQVRLGFSHFVSVPFTKDWLQIQCEAAIGKFTDNAWLRNHFNYYNSFITTGVWYHYKRFYFRTNPYQPFCVTVGMQHGAQFGGNRRVYHEGALIMENIHKLTARDFFDVLIPNRNGSDGYYEGNSTGSWDLRLTYRLHSGARITAYMQSPWEDGSGIGKLNGFDGVWGLEWDNPEGTVLKGCVLEYLDFTNQSGPMHWAPADHPGTTVDADASGADNYYNNYYYDGWANYGRSIGSPFFPGPIYNTDGYLRFADTRLRGFHIGLKGDVVPQLSWRALFSWRRGYGEMNPRLRPENCTAAMIEGVWTVKKIPGLTVRTALSFDAGRLIGNNFGILASACYTGALSF